MAAIWAENSYCKRRQVGCLIVKEKMIISDGYNGTPTGFENDCETEDNRSKPYVLHAEANAITKVAKSHNSSDGATLYVVSTVSPTASISFAAPALKSSSSPSPKSLKTVQPLNNPNIIQRHKQITRAIPREGSLFVVI